jgi:hypothetical protein
MKMMYTVIISRLILKNIIGVILIALCATTLCHAQSKERTRLRSYYFNHSDGQRQLSFLLTSGRGRNMQNVKDAVIEVEIDLGDSAQYLTELITNEAGYADLYIQEGYTFPVDEEGITTILASYGGNDTLRSSSTDIEIKDVFLELNFDVEDSVKVLSIEANERNPEGEFIPVEELDINIGVQRLYSVLPLDDIETDENGMGIFEFPDDIPGDSAGNLIIVARIDEHDYFGTVEKSQSVDWGIPVSYDLKKLPRQLFTDEAPLWMISAVFIVLVGAWYHFFLSVFKLYKLKNAADDK